MCDDKQSSSQAVGPIAQLVYTFPCGVVQINLEKLSLAKTVWRFPKVTTCNNKQSSSQAVGPIAQLVYILGIFPCGIRHTNFSKFCFANTDFRFAKVTSCNNKQSSRRAAGIVLLIFYCSQVLVCLLVFFFCFFPCGVVHLSAVQQALLNTSLILAGVTP